jgi:hypothetical protein
VRNSKQLRKQHQQNIVVVLLMILRDFFRDARAEGRFLAMLLACSAHKALCSLLFSRKFFLFLIFRVSVLRCFHF